MLLSARRSLILSEHFLKRPKKERKIRNDETHLTGLTGNLLIINEQKMDGWIMEVSMHWHIIMAFCSLWWTVERRSRKTPLTSYDLASMSFLSRAAFMFQWWGLLHEWPGIFFGGLGMPVLLFRSAGRLLPLQSLADYFWRDLSWMGPSVLRFINGKLKCHQTLKCSSLILLTCVKSLCFFS